jgi:hypothetical protein
MYRRNIAGQNLPFSMVSATTGAALTGLTVTVKTCIDGADQAAATGTVTEKGLGQYNLALSQADTNGNQIGYLFTATGAIPVHIAVVMTAADPTDAQRFGLTVLPTSGVLAVNPVLNATQTGVTIPTVTNLTNAPTVGDLTAAMKTSTENAVWDAVIASHLGAGSTGDKLNAAASAGDPWTTSVPGAYGAGTAGKILGDNLNATVSSRSTYAGGAVASVTAGVIVTTNNDKAGYTVSTVSDKTGYSLSPAGIQAVWDALTSALTAVGSIGKKLADWVIGTPQTGDAFASLTGNRAEPVQGAPAASTSMLAKVDFLYKAWRNRNTQTASQYSLYNDDAVTVDHKATFSDDATTASRGEIGTGP